MSGRPGDVVLQIQTGPGRYEAWSYDGVPASRAVWVTIVASGTGHARDSAQALWAELDMALRDAVPGVTVAKKPDAISPDDAVEADYDGYLAVLVITAAADAPLRATPLTAKWDAMSDPVVMTVLPSGAYESFFDPALPSTHLLRRANAAIWTKAERDVLPAILARSEITALTPRVFLSYRRAETLPVALQLYDRLSHDGFDVFLDRYSIGAGYDFQRRLSQELADKAVVVFLESPSVSASEWTRHEITYAIRNRLGMLVLRLPNVDPSASLVVSPDSAIQLWDGRDGTATDFTGPPTPTTDSAGKTYQQWPLLVRASEDRVVGAIQATHADATFRRRHRLRLDIVSALRNSGVPCTYSSLGPLTATVRSSPQLIWVTTRPPTTDDFQGLHTMHGQTSGAMHPPRGVLVGPQAALEPDRRRQLQWLEFVTGCVPIDEGQLASLAVTLAAPQDQP
jgi:hypothetical protein